MTNIHLAKHIVSKRKGADMIYHIVSDTLESYAKRLPIVTNHSSSTES